MNFRDLINVTTIGNFFFLLVPNALRAEAPRHNYSRPAQWQCSNRPPKTPTPPPLMLLFSPFFT